MIERILRALKLDPTLYREVALGEQFTTEAAMIAVGVAVLAGIGSLLSGSFVGFLMGIILGLLLGWVLWAFLAQWIGGLQGGTANFNQMLRGLGYARVPGALSLLSFIPILGGLLAFIGGIWSLVAGVIAIREAHQFDTTKAIVTAIVGWLVYIIATMLITSLLIVGPAVAIINTFGN